MASACAVGRGVGLPPAGGVFARPAAGGHALGQRLPQSRRCSGIDQTASSPRPAARPAPGRPGSLLRNRDGGTTACCAWARMILIGLVAVERRHAGQQVIRHRAQRIDVAAGVGFAVAQGLLGRHEQRRAGDRAFLRQVHRFGVGRQRLGQAEVEQLGHVVHAASLGGEDVARLDVAMDQPQRSGPRPSASHVCSSK